MSGIVRLAASIVILLVAGLATALVFDVIPPDVFGDALKKLLLTVVIAGLTIGALAFVARVGK